MKNAIILLVLSVTMTMNAQWTKNFYVDDFGDATTDSYESFITGGTFSNSATQNSKASYKFIRNDDSIVINVYRYGSSLATSTKATFEDLKVKQPDGTIVVLKSVFFSKGGYLYFNKEGFVEFNNVISTKGAYVIIFDRTSKYSTSSYKIKFTIK